MSSANLDLTRTTFGLEPTEDVTVGTTKKIAKYVLDLVDEDPILKISILLDNADTISLLLRDIAYNVKYDARIKREIRTLNNIDTFSLQLIALMYKANFY